MGAGTYLALAFGPALILVHAVWSRDRRREPIGNLSVYLLVGALSVLPAALVEYLAHALIPGLGFPPVLVLGAAIWTFLVIGPVEEGCKFIALWQRGVRDPHLDEPFDWLVYAVAVSLGFATVENCGYVAIGGLSVGLVRAFTAVPGHALHGTLMGWRLARAEGRPGAAGARERRLAWIEPTIWHAANDVTHLALRPAGPLSAEIGTFLAAYDFPLLALRAAGGGDAAILLVLSWAAIFGTEWVVCARRLRRMCADQHIPPPPLLLSDRLARRRRSRGAESRPPLPSPRAQS